MKSRMLIWTIAISLFAALLGPARLAAQGNGDHSYRKHLRYKVVDTGTLGGPTSSLGFEGERDINNRGAMVSLADTSIPDPYAPNCFLDCFLAHAVVWRNGVLADLGALPGVNNSGPIWISDTGLVSGLSQNSVIDPLTQTVEFRAVLWNGSQIIDLGTLGGNESLVGAVNNRGQVVGGATNMIADSFATCGIPVGVPQQCHAFLWQDGVMRDLGTLGGPDSFGLLVNNRGQVAGVSFLDSNVNPNTGIPTQHPFLWNNGDMKDLGTIGGTAVFQLNHLIDRGELVGGMLTEGDQAVHPFLWDGDELKDLGTLGGSFGNAIWLNETGAVVGLASTEGDQVQHAFLWQHGLMTDLGTAQGDQCSVAYAINSRGQIVGSSDDCSGNNGNALLWDDEHLINLNTFVPSGSGVQLTVALNISEKEEIAAQGVLANGDIHAFVMIPCEGEHVGDDGCESEGEAPTIAIQNNPGSTDLNSALAKDTGLTQRELANRTRTLSGRAFSVSRGKWF